MYERDFWPVKETVSAVNWSYTEYSQKFIISGTKDDTKVNNIKEAISIFDKFLDDFDTLHLSKQNNPYLPLGVVLSCLNIAEEKGLDVTDQVRIYICFYLSLWPATHASLHPPSLKISTYTPRPIQVIFSCTTCTHVSLVKSVLGVS